MVDEREHGGFHDAALAMEDYTAAYLR